MFAHAAAAFEEVASGATVTFVPYALADWDDYADRVTAALGAFGIDVASAHRSDAPDRAIRDAEVVMMGGGNSFRLLDVLYGFDVHGWSREERIGEFLEENHCPVLAMYEGSWLRVTGDTATVTGPARLFQSSGCEAFDDGVDVSELLQLTPMFDGGRRLQRGDSA